MDSRMDTKKDVSQIYIVLNPVAGHSGVDDIHKMLEERFQVGTHIYEVYETTGEEDVAELTKAACSRGSTLVVAAGGDGTVAGVVNGLQQAKVPLGIIPVGTGNGLARALQIPLSIDQAIDLLAGENELMNLDALRVEDKIYVLNVSAGISANAMQETPHTEKKRWGVLAYVRTIIAQLVGFQPRRFWLTIDGHRVMIRASEILVSNGELLKDPFPLGPRERFNDGMMDIYIINANNLIDYLKVAWNALVHRGEKKQELRHMEAKKSVKIESVGSPLPTQADGETLGVTPVEIEIIPDALQVIVPKANENQEEKNGRKNK
ncbi:MAG: diacylglycerol kinase family lipid kinase [Chloroflexi bacterium]|nr:MAG: diacylglycerol kinase family lipid kinase [Chloroflexota bacterium]